MSLALWLMLAADLPAGKIIDSVPAAANPKLSYALYLPSAYKADRAWPVLYCLDPGARGRVPVERFAKAAEAEGFVVAGSNNSRNGPIGPVQEAIGAMLDDTNARFALDPKRYYAAGLSGGARVALGWALGGRIAGVVACGAGFGQPLPPKQIPFELFAVAGVDDFNHGELYELSIHLAPGVRQRFAEFEGGHEWLPELVALEALRFFNGKLPPKPATPSKDERKVQARLEETLAHLETSGSKGKEKLIGQLRARSDEAADSPDRRAARRALGGAFIGAIERARDAMDRADYATAIPQLETALLIRPDAANAKSMLERARAGKR